MKGQNKMTKEIIADLADDFMDHLERKIKTAKEANIHDTLDATLEQLGFTDEAKTKAAALFDEAVANKDSKLRAGLGELLSVLPFLTEDTAEVIDELSDRIAELENDIAYYERHNQQLASSLAEKLSERYGLNESVVTSLWGQSDSFEDLQDNLQQAAQPERKPKRSRIEDQLEGGVSYNLSGEINEDGSFAQNEEEHDPRMAAYMKFFRA
jgi:hypothetical protein